MSEKIYTLLVLLIMLVLLIDPPRVDSRTLNVGPDRQYTLPSQAAAVAMDGDTILIDAGEYADAARWRANDLLIRGVGGYAHVRDRTYGRKAIWVIQGNNTTVEWIEFSGARVPDNNGAGIRQEGTNLTLRHCSFHHNEMGILTNNDAASHVVIEYCHFASNGYGDGYSHNMYINHVGRFTLRFSYSHDAVIGHNVKSRAHENYILYNRLDQAGGGNTSREIDLPNGGLAVIVGNILDHGPNTDNSNLIGFGMEGFSNPRATIVVANNTFLTARGAGGFVTLPQSGTDTVRVVNNIFAGLATMLTGNAAVIDTAANLIVRDIADAGFRDRAARDYHLLPSSPAIDAGVDPGSIDGFSLLPAHEYRHPTGSRPRADVPPVDLGAHAYQPATGVRAAAGIPSSIHLLGNHPNPFRGGTDIRFILDRPAAVTLTVTDLLGREVRRMRNDVMLEAGRHHVRFNAAALPPGVYLCRLAANGATRTHRMLLVR